MNSKITYEEMDFTVCMSAMDFCFSLLLDARSIIAKFSKKSKGQSLAIVGLLPEFSTTCAPCILCLSKKIENCTFVCCLSCNVSLSQQYRNTS